ncbi:hypothetical protein ACFWYW_46735 [Nonomuraea sp. NPDC059023]|uniref:hypothetical protein n=1 Tax=unclassified Nonomuraea TaxID=2593643 RepID=UPI003683C671
MTRQRMYARIVHRAAMLSSVWLPIRPLTSPGYCNLVKMLARATVSLAMHAIHTLLSHTLLL